MEKCIDMMMAQLANTHDKSMTMKRELKDLKIYKNQQIRQLRHHEDAMNKTKEMFERSLSDIRSTYDRSQQIIFKDIDQLEQKANEMRNNRTKKTAMY